MKVTNLDLSIFLTSAILNAALTALVVVKRRQHLKNETNASFVLSVVFVIAWFAANYLADSRSNAQDALFWTRMTVPPSLLALWLLSWFSFVFPVKAQKYTSKLVILFAAVAVISAASFTRFIFERVEIKAGAGVSDMTLGFLYPAMIAAYLLLAAVIMYNLIAKHRRLRGAHRMQVKYVMLGWGLFFVGGLTVSLILPYFTGNADWSKFGPLFSVPMVAAIAYAIVKHQFLDIRVIIQRGIIYTVLLALIVGFYLIAVFVLGTLFRRATDVTVTVSALLTAIAGIFGVSPIDRYFRRVTDKIFFKDRYDYSEALHTLSHILNRTIERGDIVRQASEAFERILKVVKVSFFFSPADVPPSLAEYFKSNHDVIDCSDLPHTAHTGAIREFAHEYSTAIIVPIVLEQSVIAVMTLGKKKSGDRFTGEDMKLLKTFAYQAAVAFSKAELYRQVKEYSETLEQKVFERTKEIKEMQEDQKQMMVDISHNLQTPLTVVKGELGILERSLPGNPNLKVFEHSIDDISRFIYDLLKLAKLEHGSEAVEMRPLDLSELLDELVEYFEVLAAEQAITVGHAIEPYLTILGNKEKLTELVNNLVSNAMKYVANEKQIRITLKRVGNQAELVVADTGIGIPAEDLPHIFERFYRVKRKGEGIRGSGLGLAICKRIVAMHRGTIDVQSELGKGTAFTVRFLVV